MIPYKWTNLVFLRNIYSQWLDCVSQFYWLTNLYKVEVNNTFNFISMCPFKCMVVCHWLNVWFIQTLVREILSNQSLVPCHSNLLKIQYFFVENTPCQWVENQKSSKYKTSYYNILFSFKRRHRWIDSLKHTDYN